MAGQTSDLQQFPLASIRPGHGEDLSTGRVSNYPGTTTVLTSTTALVCGPPNRESHHERYDARVPGSQTSFLLPGCYAPYPSGGSVVGVLGPNARITFFSTTPTSLGLRISGLTSGKLTFRIVGKKVSGRAKVRTQISLKA